MTATQIHKYRILTHFSICQDHRKHRIKHKLADIIVLVVLAVLCGEEGWDDIHDWGSDKEEFLREFLELESGIPSSDTIRRVIERLNPDTFLQAFLSWAKEISERKPGQICIDGKTLKKAMGKDGPLHLVSAFAVDNGITLGCKEAECSKGKEIPAIKELLESLSLKPGDIITTDAIACQTKITNQIGRGNIGYVIGLKGNQGILRDEAHNFFAQAFEAEEYAPVETHEQESKGHGRQERHKVWVTTDLEWLDIRWKWKSLKSLICVQREWISNGEKKQEMRFYISNLTKTAEEFAELIRRHWAIENEYHWHLDVTFREDDSEIAARSNRILRVARTIALQLLKAEPTPGMSIRRKKRRCHRSETFLRKMLLIGNF